MLLAGAAVTRPDGLLVYGICGLFVEGAVLLRPGSLRAPIAWLSQRLRTHAGLFLIFAPALVFRVVYYGELVPNTFYAKSAHDPYAGQGLHYLSLYLSAYWLLLGIPVLLVAAGFARLRAKRSLRPPFAGAIAAAVVGAYVAYVVWVGGDFMFARFLIPVTPLALLLLEALLRDLWESLEWRWDARAAGAAALILAGAVLLRYDPYRCEPAPIIQYVGEEQKIYTPERVRYMRELALKLRPTIQSAQPLIEFVGAQSVLIYYLDPATAIESQTGLTDRFIARQPVTERGWVGHEKTAPLSYLNERGVHLLLRPPPPDRRRPESVFRIAGLPGEFEILNYDEAVFAILRQDASFQLPAP